MKKKIVVLLTLLLALIIALPMTALAFAEEPAPSPAPMETELVKGMEYTFTKDGTTYAVTLLSDTEYSLVTKNGEENSLVHLGKYTYENERLTLKKDDAVVGVYLVHQTNLIDVTAFENVVDKLPEEIKDDAKKGVDEFYSWIKPYLGYALTFGVGGLVVGFVVYLIVKHVLKKFEQNYEAKRIAKTFVEEIGKQDISLDVSAVVETKLETIRKDLVSDIKPVVDNFAAVQNAVAYLCAAMTNSKVVPAEIRDELAAHAKNLNSSAVCKQKDVVKLHLAKAPTVEKTDDEKATAEGLFGGYNENA